MTFEWDKGANRMFCILGMDLRALTMVKQGIKGPCDLNEASKAHGKKQILEPLHTPFRGEF